MPVEHELREDGDRLIVSFRGDLDLESSPEARRVLLDCVARAKSLLVDLSAVPYLDSSGVASLVEAYQISRSQGTSFGLASVSPRALRVLQLARLDKVFSIHPSVDAPDGR
jgi:anti-sigma B factor antagonist